MCWRTTKVTFSWLPHKITRKRVNSEVVATNSEFLEGVFHVSHFQGSCQWVEKKERKTREVTHFALVWGNKTCIKKGCVNSWVWLCLGSTQVERRAKRYACPHIGNKWTDKILSDITNKTCLTLIIQWLSSYTQTKRPLGYFDPNPSPYFTVDSNKYEVARSI